VNLKEEFWGIYDSTRAIKTKNQGVGKKRSYPESFLGGSTPPQLSRVKLYHFKQKEKLKKEQASEKKIPRESYGVCKGRWSHSFHGS
jgi:hypothetical protein